MSGTAVLILAAMSVVLMAMMVTVHIGVVVQRSRQQCPDRVVRPTGHAAVELDPCAPAPMPPQISVSTFRPDRNPARAP